MGVETRCPRNPMILLQEHYDGLLPKVCKNGNWTEVVEEEEYNIPINTPYMGWDRQYDPSSQDANWM